MIMTTACWQEMKLLCFRIHWRIQGGGRQGRAPPGGPNSFIFMQFSAKNRKIIALLGVGAPPWGKSWIRHWYLLIPFANKILFHVAWGEQKFPTCHLDAVMIYPLEKVPRLE